MLLYDFKNCSFKHLSMLFIVLSLKSVMTTGLWNIILKDLLLSRGLMLRQTAPKSKLFLAKPHY